MPVSRYEDYNSYTCFNNCCTCDRIIISFWGRDFFDCNEGVDRVLDFDPDEDTANVNCENLE